MITVCNIRGQIAAFRANKHGVYIGRTMPLQGLAGSPLANPFKLPPDFRLIEGYRLETIARYEQWLKVGLRQEGKVWQEFKRLCELAQQGDLDLYCWCAPLGCHGDVLKRLIEEANVKG